MKGLQVGPDGVYEPEPILRAVLIIAAVLFALSGVTRADDNGYQKRPFRDRKTSEPLLVEGPRGTVYSGDVAVKGQVFTLDLALSSGIDSTDAGQSCTPQEAGACWQACENQLDDPFCCQFGSECMQAGGGAVECHCMYFCATTSDGQGHKPKRLEVRDEFDDGGLGGE